MAASVNPFSAVVQSVHDVNQMTVTNVGPAVINGVFVYTGKYMGREYTAKSDLSAYCFWSPSRGKYVIGAALNDLIASGYDCDTLIGPAWSPFGGAPGSLTSVINS